MNMKGFTLLESMIALSFFLVVLLSGYAAFLNQQELYEQVLPRTRAEEESNYRFWILKQKISESTTGLRQNPLLEKIPLFFTDLAFGKGRTPDAFSVGSVTGTPVPFRKAGSWYEVPAGAGIEPPHICLIAGADELGSYSWNFVRVTDAAKGSMLDRLRWILLMEKSPPEHGTLVKVNITGLRFRDGALYEVNTAGSSLPFFDAIREFNYTWEPPLLTVRWTAGPVRLACRIYI